MYYNSAEVVTSMRAASDAYLEIKSGKRQMANKYWEMRSTFQLAHRLWLPNTRVCAVILDEKVLGSSWVPCRMLDADPRMELALCVYLNSSVGYLALLGARLNRKPGYPKFQLDTWRSVYVPVFSTFPGALDRLAPVYYWLGDETLLPLPEMHHDPVRIRIDQAVTEALGLDPEWVARIRRELSREPSITNRRYADEADHAS